MESWVEMKSLTFIHSFSKASKQFLPDALMFLTGIGTQRKQSPTTSFGNVGTRQSNLHPQPTSEPEDVGKPQHDINRANISLYDEKETSMNQLLQPQHSILAPIFRRAGGELSTSVKCRDHGLLSGQHEVEDSHVHETDLNKDRRKRRRTNSVEITGNLLVQPSHDPLLSQMISQSPSIDQPNAIQRPSTPVQETQEPESLLNGPPHHDHASLTSAGTGPGPFSEGRTSMSGISSNPDTTAVPFSASLDGTADTKPGSGPKTPKKTRTPNKKVLKLNANGKLLSSPQAPTTSTFTESPTRRKATSKKRGARGSKFVVMRYSTETTRKRIAEILTGNGKTGIIQFSKEPPQPKVSKATHPFFLARNKEDTAVEAEATPTSPERNQKNVVSSTTPIKPTTRISMQSFEDKPDMVGYRGTTFSRNPDALAPVWPPREFKHVLSPIPAVAQKQPVPTTYRQNLRKSKQTVALMSDAEDIIKQTATHIVEGDAKRPRSSVIRLPIRKLLSGRECLDAVDSAVNSGQGMGSLKIHPGVRDLRSLLPKATPAFDEGKCESLPWTAKYAPGRAEQVLQSGREAVYLRDWIRSLTISSVDTGSSKASADKSKAAVKLGRKKKRIKRTDEDLDGFVVSSDDEVNELVEASEDELTLPGISGLKRSAFRNGSATSRQGSQETPKNAILLSGPYGCGKTASVYAVSKELGFEVFEINPGSRRSAKDIFDKVGDMTRNHLVQRQGSESGSVDEQTVLDTEHVQDEIASGRQGTMTTFFKSNAPTSGPQKRGRPKTWASKIPAPTTRPKKSQKQSLILIEEADVLYEEDKTFWNAIITLTSQSKRPIIITCSNESLIPFDDLSLEAILRFTPILPEVAAEYLVTIAAAEGHLIGKRHASALYTLKGQDLRASITELNFWCQMAVGSTKGSLDWMFNVQKESQCNSSGEPLRITSIETYQDDMSLIPRHLHLSNAGGNTANLEHLMLFAESELDIPIVDWIDNPEPWAQSSFKNLDEEKSALQFYSRIAHVASDLDVISSVGLKRNGVPTLDASYPDLSLKARTNYCEGYPLLEAFEIPDYTSTTSRIATALGSRLLNNSSVSSSPTTFIKTQLHRRYASQSAAADRATILTALAPLETPPPVFPPPAPGRIAISIEPLVPATTLAADLAPYVRYIVAYDHRLELQREALLLSSQEGGSGSIGKRKSRGRTTKASRAALEGGRKEETRRENWFHRKVNLEEVMRTGGEGWTNKLLQSLDHQLTVDGGESFDASMGEVESQSQATEEGPT